MGHINSKLPLIVTGLLSLATYPPSRNDVEVDSRIKYLNLALIESKIMNIVNTIMKEGSKFTLHAGGLPLCMTTTGVMFDLL